MKSELVSMRLKKEELDPINEIARDEKTDKTTAIRKALDLGTKQYLLEKSINEYREGKLSIGKAAEKAKISLWEMLDELKDRNIQSNLGSEEYKESLNNLRKKWK